MRYSEQCADLPEDLLSALIEDRLVIFVGAGISYRRYRQQKKDTYFPLFQGLCEQISRKLSIELDTTQKELLRNGPFDQLLGIWNDQGHDVHKTAAQILSEREDLKQNTLHKTIMDLFPAETIPRVVTTNFDNLFNIALKSFHTGFRKKWGTYIAPALPPGRKRFRGICYLHGNVSNPDEMILTDADIGRAYMDEGWGLKFAHELFQNFAVLFIGYSLNDPPLRYLSLALSGVVKKDTGAAIWNKWALVPKEKRNYQNKKNWERMGVIPIEYPVINSSHRALTDTLMNWSTENKKGFIDKRTTSFQLIKSDPYQLPPHKLDLVLYYIKTPELLRDMAKIGFNESWYPILEEKGYLEPILNKKTQLANHDLALANNLVDLLIQEPIKWILKLENRRSTINPYLFTLFCLKYDKNDINIEKEKLRQILEFFRPSIQYNSADNYSYHLDRLVSDLIEFKLYDDAIWILFQILDIEVRITTSFGYMLDEMEGRQSKLEPELEGKAEFRGQSRDYIFKKYLDKHYLPLIETIGYQLLLHFTYILYDLLISLNRLRRNEYTYVHRPTIEMSKDHYAHEVLDFCLNSISEIWNKLLIKDSQSAELIFRLWSKFKEPLFKRLSIYAIDKLLKFGYVKS